MDCTELRNWGKCWTGKASPKVLMGTFSWLPIEIGLRMPKFLIKFPTEDRKWKKRKFNTPATYPEFLEGIRYTLAFYGALEKSCGKNRALVIWDKLMKRAGVEIYEEFLPEAKDFAKCGDPWQTTLVYLRDSFFAMQRDEKVIEYEVVKDTPDELQFHVSRCAWHDIPCEAGWDYLPPINGQVDLEFLPRFAESVGGSFKRDSWLCKGDKVCDFHFYR